MRAMASSTRRTGAASASATPVERISAICIAKARIAQMPSYQEATILFASAGVHTNAAMAVTKVRIRA
jgi:hypothetical protein